MAAGFEAKPWQHPGRRHSLRSSRGALAPCKETFDSSSYCSRPRRVLRGVFVATSSLNFSTLSYWLVSSLAIKLSFCRVFPLLIHALFSSFLFMAYRYWLVIVSFPPRSLFLLPKSRPLSTSTLPYSYRPVELLRLSPLVPSSASFPPTAKHDSFWSYLHSNRLLSGPPSPLVNQTTLKIFLARKLQTSRQL